MPDQSTASTEHAILQEISAPLETLPDDPVPAVADVDFPIVLRGYDRLAVDAYVRRTSQLVAELQATHSPESAVRRALERVGEEVGDILKRAHDTASQITAQSRVEAEDRLEVARREAGEITAVAERRLRELDAETDRIWGERHRIVEDARELAAQLLELAQSASARFPAEAEETAASEPAGEAAELEGLDDAGEAAELEGLGDAGEAAELEGLDGAGDAAERDRAAETAVPGGDAAEDLTTHPGSGPGEPVDAPGSESAVPFDQQQPPIGFVPDDDVEYDGDETAIMPTLAPEDEQHS